MQTNFQLNVSNPCHEPWEDFKPTPEGGFCGSCQKNVIDFSGMTESQLVAYFRDLATENQHLCGRFRNDQLQKNYRIDEWFPTFTITNKMVHYEVPIGQIKEAQNKITLPLIRKMKMVRNMAAAILTFTMIEQGCGQQKHLAGQVVDATDGSPLIGVSIQVKGTTKGIVSDAKGRYQIAVGERDTLVFSSVGFKSAIMPTKTISPIISMKMDAEMLGEVAVVGYATKRMENVVAGGISVCRATNNETDEALSIEEKSTSKFKTNIKALGNPTVAEEVEIVVQLDEKAIINNPEERDEVADWYAKNGFQTLESVQVYDLSGKTYQTSFHKINNGKISINLKNVPSGMHLVRVKYSHERSIENEDISVVRIWVNK